MKKTFTLFSLLMLCLTAQVAWAQANPELLYYKFSGTGNTVPNEASAPPPGTAIATIQGSITQGAGGLCGGALIGSGNASSTDYLNTGYAPNLTGSWTISMYTRDITPSSTLFYIFGDANSGSFRCFTNGVAGPNNWILRGTGITDVYINGGATVAGHLTTFVYDQPTNNIYGYLDGVLVTTVAQPGPVISGAGPFKVMGYGTNVGAPAGGKLDEFRMYSRALTAAEVMELMTPHTTGTIAPVSCGNYLSPSGNTYSASGTYTDTIPNAEGCDSIITINLSVIQPSASSVTESVCGSYTAPSGAVYTMSGTYMDTITNAAGCDSVITISLTVRMPSTNSFTAGSCYSYVLPSGMTVMSSGTYMDTISNAVGCDSVLTIDVTIFTATGSTVNPSVCDNFTAPSGAMYTMTGTYYDTIMNAAGCDSIITINLTVTNSTTSSMTLSSCDSVIAPSGAVYTASGTYMDTIPNAAGCDSVITIVATVSMPTSSGLPAVTCGPFIAPSGAVYTTSGIYTDIIPNAAGCDSVITILLQVNTVNVQVSQVNATLTAAASGATYQWIDCANNTPVAGATSQAFTALANGSYAVIVIDSNCMDTSACFTVTGIGIAEQEFASVVTLYPNPGNGQFTVDLGASYSNVTVVVTDLAGRVVFTSDVNDAQLIPVELEGAAGIYTMQVRAGDATAVLRVVKE
jgi:hypothetical protein